MGETASTQKEKFITPNLDIDKRATIKFILKKHNKWSGLIWHRKGPNAGLLQTKYEAWGSIRGGRFIPLNEQHIRKFPLVSGSQENENALTSDSRFPAAG
jgi:hypothetical protein